MCLFVDVRGECELGILFIIKEVDCLAGAERIVAVDMGIEWTVMDEFGADR